MIWFLGKARYAKGGKDSTIIQIIDILAPGAEARLQEIDIGTIPPFIEKGGAAGEMEIFGETIMRIVIDDGEFKRLQACAHLAFVVHVSNSITPGYGLRSFVR